MNILAICCALNNTYLGLQYSNQIYSKIIKSDENYHSLYLINEIKELFKKNSFDFKKLDAITVNCGPGSFTGIRVALSIAKVMASEINLPLIGLNSAQILLNAFNKKYLIMDARRDMYFIAKKDNIELKLKEEVIKTYQNEDVLCDKNSKQYFPNSICYEETEKDLAKVMLNIAQETFDKESDKTKFNHQLVEANYIQTPPIF